ncbi:hypothetical protein OSTOST_16037 [Ostertagia ostertagi]
MSFWLAKLYHLPSLFAKFVRENDNTNLYIAIHCEGLDSLCGKARWRRIKGARKKSGNNCSKGGFPKECSSSRPGPIAFWYTWRWPKRRRNT